MRFAHHTVSAQAFGQEPEINEVIVFMTFDGMFIGPLLIGIGGAGLMINEPNRNES